jgi:hypothetical protein
MTLFTGPKICAAAKTHKNAVEGRTKVNPIECPCENENDLRKPRGEREREREKKQNNKRDSASTKKVFSLRKHRIL